MEQLKLEESWFTDVLRKRPYTCLRPVSRCDSVEIFRHTIDKTNIRVFCGSHPKSRERSTMMAAASGLGSTALLSPVRNGT
jgi:hypothetical protein